jgi:alkane 1-monooxygenase
MLEAVNYFEHYGLARRMKRVRPIDSWDTDSWFSLYTLVGLSRHADHHAFASRPYQQLRHWEQSPKLPYGYFGMVWMVLTQNETFRTMMEVLLRKHGLGPFEIDAASEGARAAAKAA